MDRKFQNSLQYLLKNNVQPGTDQIREELNYLLDDLKILSDMNWDNMDKPTQQFVQYYAHSMSMLLMVWEAMDQGMGINQTIH